MLKWFRRLSYLGSHSNQAHVPTYRNYEMLEGPLRYKVAVPGIKKPGFPYLQQPMTPNSGPEILNVCESKASGDGVQVWSNLPVCTSSFSKDAIP